uniref:DUF2793 domain-containing protein n=1 Tax=viral metagenome TaxID=1070528 RepID=A0A6M3J552_9ZZZZ
MATYRVPVLDEFSWQPPVLDKDLTAPPGGESKGDRYIVAADATGAWSGLDGHIVTYTGAAWLDATPAEGWYVYVADENVLYHYTGAAWDADDISGIETDITSIDTRISNVESSVGSIDTHVDSCDSSIVSIDTRATNIESSVGSINTAKQDKGVYVSEYGAIEFTI